MDYTRRLVSPCFVLFCLNILLPQASPQECVPPFIPMNGSYKNVKPKYTTGDEITYDCSKGFFLIGDKKRTCRTDRTWNGQMPFCDDHKLELHSASVEGYVSLKQQEAIDKFLESCSPLQPSQGLQISLKDKAVVDAIRVLLPKGVYDLDVSIRDKDNRITTCGTIRENLKGQTWQPVTCDQTVTAKEICIRDISSRPKKWEICEVEVYGHRESLCKNPPAQVHVPDTYLIINRQKALMKCKGTKDITELYFLCEEGQWKPVGKEHCKEHSQKNDTGKTEHSQKDDNAKTVIIASVVTVCFVFACFVVAFVFIYKKRQNSVVVVMKPKEHYCRAGCQMHPPEEAEYAAIIYEDIPLTPTQMKKLPKNFPPDLPDILKEYQGPIDEDKASTDGYKHVNYAQNPGYTIPQDSLLKNNIQLGDLKASSFYGK